MPEEQLRSLIEDLKANPEYVSELADLLRSPPREPADEGLATYKGAANNPDLLKHLIGERIVAAFFGRDPKSSTPREQVNLYLVLESGHAFVLGRSPSYWAAGPEQVKRVVEIRRKEIERNLSELREMPGVRLP